jgi:hypothetical protein
MRRPSAISLISLAAFTFVLDFIFSNLSSNSLMESIHGSPTSVSRINLARVGEIVMSEIRSESGFSIFCTEDYFSVRIGGAMHDNTLRLLSRCSMFLLRSCSSDICPETWVSSFRKLDKKFSNWSRRLTLVYGILNYSQETQHCIHALPSDRVAPRILSPSCYLSVVRCVMNYRSL